VRYELQLGWRYLYAGHRESGLLVGLALSLATTVLGLVLMWQLGGGNPIGVICFLLGLGSASVFTLLSLLSVASAVAALGVVLGVAALTVVLSVTSGFQDQFKSKVLGVNAHVIVMKNSQDFAEYRDVMATSRRC
jgi:lipoprotein-releasing system permease protein